MVLLNKYTWAEVAQYYTARLEKTLKKDADKFFKWFLTLEKLGLFFDPVMYLRAFNIHRELEAGLDHFVVTCGREGMGKSTFSFQLAATVNPDGFNLNNVCYGAKDYLEILARKADSGDVRTTESLVMDEGTEILSKEAMTSTNRALMKTFFIQRALGFLVIINIPNFHMLDTVIRMHRVRTLVSVLQRGKYKCIVGKGINNVNRFGSKTKDVAGVGLGDGTFFHGTFSKGFPTTIDRAEYEKMKLEGIQTTLRDLRNEHAPVEAKEQPEQRYYRPEEMAMVLGVPRGRIISWIRSRRIRGEKIGGSWMIPKTQYEAYVKPNDAI